MTDLLLENKLLSSILIILCSYLVKSGLIVFIKKRAKKSCKDYRYLLNTIKNVANLILVILLFLFWADELQKFAFSIAAFIVAIVLATREYLQCFIGFLYITSTSPFRVGDWVQTGQYSGEVISTDWAKLTMLEIDQTTYTYTGKTLFIPNNQLITQPIKNLNFLKRYISHEFSITMNYYFDPYLNSDRLLAKAKEYCREFQDVAERYNSMIERSLEVSLSGPEPTVSISTTDLGRIKTSFSIFCPTGQAMEIESKLTRDFFELNKKSKSMYQEVE